MKKKIKNIVLLIALFMGKFIVAQTIGINYQALVLDVNRDTGQNNNPIANNSALVSEEVNLRFTITNSPYPDDNYLYGEEQFTFTDEHGLISLIVGEGLYFTDPINTVIWDGTTKYLNVEIDIIKDGQGYVFLDSKKILNIPQTSSLQNLSVSNGLTNTNGTIELGGTLNRPTTINTSETNTIAITGLSEGDPSTDLVVTVDGTTGTLKQMTPGAFARKQEEITIANDGQTVFTTPLNITDPKKISVFRNGVKIGFLVLDTTSLQLETGVICFQNDEIRIVQLY